MTDFEALSGDELYELGLAFGELSKTRPDIAHKFLIGVRDGMDQSDNYGFGEILSALWRRWHHTIATPKTPPPILFTSLSAPSGNGKVSS